ncbi:MAG: type II toxin-antitoxin system PemK/MazF family toxin [Gemmatimonadetes bacterium]|nr:type II toxin-antitoxin system PemK/MazF family toxin [Gemmatimonadota bacterium]
MQLPSTIYEPGDVVAVRFQFREHDRPKPRPAVIISVSEYQESRIDAVMIAVSTRTDKTYFGDCMIQDWKDAGLVEGSKAKGYFRTIEKSKIRQRIGRLSDLDKTRLQQSIRHMLGL